MRRQPAGSRWGPSPGRLPYPCASSGGRQPQGPSAAAAPLAGPVIVMVSGSLVRGQVTAGLRESGWRRPCLGQELLHVCVEAMCVLLVKQRPKRRGSEFSDCEVEN